MNELFKKYAAAFESFDATAIAGLYTLPCSTSDSDGANVFSDRESLIQKFAINCAAMKAMGYSHSHFNILHKIDMGETAKSVNIGWRIFTTSREVEFRGLYVCHKVNNSWLIFSANVYQGSFSQAE
jgi:hypothetical protein